MTLKQTRRAKSCWILWAACLVLVFGAGLVSAQESICDPGNFCDADEDTYIRDHRKCRDCLGGAPPDCDDNDGEVTTECYGGTPVMYTVKLTGPFAFAPTGAEIEMFPGNNRLLSDEPAFLLRPQDVYPNAWDNAFLNACNTLGGVPVGITANPDSWAVYEGVRINLIDYAVSAILDETQTPGTLETPWELWIQLKSDEDDLALPEVGQTLTYDLTQVWIWGKPEDKKGRKSDCDTFWGRLPTDTPSRLTIKATAFP